MNRLWQSLAKGRVFLPLLLGFVCGMAQALESYSPTMYFQIYGVLGTKSPNDTDVCAKYSALRGTLYTYYALSPYSYSTNYCQNYSGTNTPIVEIYECPYGGNFQPSNGECSAPSPCPSGNTRLAYGECVPTPACNAGIHQFRGTMSTTDPMNACFAGCPVEMEGLTHAALDKSGTSLVQQYTGDWKAKGGTCGTQDALYSAGNNLPPSDPQASNACISDAKGNVLCAQTAKPGCGKVNGNEYCGEQIPDSGECFFIGKNGYVCGGSSSGGAPPSPPQAVAGEGPSQKTAEFRIPPNTAHGGGNGTDVRQGSIGYYPGPSGNGTGGTDDGTGSSNQGTLECPTCASETTAQGIKTNTGDIKNLLSGTGTDTSTTGVGTSGEGFLDDTYNTIADGISNFVGMTADEFSDFTPDLPSAGTCQSMPLVFKGQTLTVFDPCPYLAKIQEALGWFFYLGTAYAIFQIATHRPGA